MHCQRHRFMSHLKMGSMPFIHHDKKIKGVAHKNGDIHGTCK